MYLENNICKFKPIGRTKIRKKKINILSGCFFKMNNHYKDFNIYVNGLKKWAEFLESFKHNYVFRLFIDSTIYNDKNIMKVINKSKKIEPVLFECKKYKKNKYHIDLFATLIRFFPLFNFKNNDSRYVLTVDIEPGNTFMNKLKIICNKNYNDLIVTRIPNYIEKKDTDKLYLMAEGILLKEKLDSNIITNFIKNAHKNKSIGKYSKRYTTWGYGVDEIFLNEVYLKKFKTSTYLYKYNLVTYIFIYLPKIIKSKKSKGIFKFILGKYYNPKMSIKDMIYFIDSAIYPNPKKKITPLINYLGKRYYKVIRYLYNNDLEWLPKYVIKLLNNYLDGLIYATVMQKINLKTEKTCSVKIIDPVYLLKHRSTGK